MTLLRSRFLAASAIARSETTVGAGLEIGLEVCPSVDTYAGSIAVRSHQGETGPDDPTHALCQETFVGGPTRVDLKLFSLLFTGPCRLALAPGTTYTVELKPPPLDNVAAHLESGCALTPAASSSHAEGAKDALPDVVPGLSPAIRPSPVGQRVLGVSRRCDQDRPRERPPGCPSGGHGR